MELLKINIAGKSASFNKNSISHLSLEELDGLWVITITTNQPYKYQCASQQEAQSLFNKLNEFLES